MLPSNNIQSIVGATIFGPDEIKLGRISQVFVDAADGHPTWAEIHSGALGRHTTYVPLHEATWENDDVHVPYDKELVKNAPRVDGEDGLTPDQEQELSRHYADVPASEEAAQPAHTAHPEKLDGTDDDSDDDASEHLDENGVLWEERVVVSKEKVPVAKVHLETTTVTEDQDVTADVRKERIMLDQEDSPDRP